MASLFVNQLTVIDASFLDKQLGVVGESWIVDVELHGDLNDQGMIFDFGKVKKQIKSVIDSTLDHKLIVPEALAEISKEDTNIAVAMQCQHGEVKYLGPESGLAIIPGDSVEAAHLVLYLSQHLSKVLPSNVTRCDIKLRHEQIDGAFYRYSHGLKKHDGACQRIAHGHRSRINVLKSGLRVENLEHECAEAWKNIYIGTSADVLGETSISSVAHLHFSYDAIDGHFELLLPASQCYLIDSDTTVENLAAHLSKKLTDKFGPCTVIAFEGVEKGAICSTEK